MRRAAASASAVGDFSVTTTTSYTVLIERRPIRWVMSVLLSMLVLLAGGWSISAHAGEARDKVARDLQEVVNAPSTPKNSHTRDINGVRHVQAIVVTDGRDPTATDLRAFILRTGGSVLVQHPGINALTVLIRAAQVNALAQRSDVLSVTPNRQTQRTASTLESITGALTANVRSSSTKTSYSGLDGSGIGIAVLDSGVMTVHKGFMDGSGATRVKRNVSMLNATLANWTTGVDSTVSLTPGSSASSSYESAIANDGNVTQDEIGRAHV